VVDVIIRRMPMARAGSAPRTDDERLAALVENEIDFVGRLLRHGGATEAEVDDLVQMVFQVLSQRLGDIEPGKERAFLAQTAVRLAANARRGHARSREVAMDQLPEVADLAASPEELSDKRRALVLLDRVLEAMDLDLRAVFVLYEIEEMTVAEIAAALQIPPGTAASRLRRAREEFMTRLRRSGTL
jgi:RNA polymerase sigma-70 factor (ECF subfamily)